jgi:hypothetical protein
MSFGGRDRPRTLTSSRLDALDKKKTDSTDPTPTTPTRRPLLFIFVDRSAAHAPRSSCGRNWTNGSGYCGLRRSSFPVITSTACKNTPCRSTRPILPRWLTLLWRLIFIGVVARFVQNRTLTGMPMTLPLAALLKEAFERRIPRICRTGRSLRKPRKGLSKPPLGLAYDFEQIVW